MEPWVIWVVAAVVLVIAEATTTAFVAIYFGFAALVTAVAAVAELEPGQVKVGGETWTARSFYDGERIAAGTRIEVVRVEGVTALVIPAPSPHDNDETK